MPFYTFRVGTYSRCIYLDGTRTFENAMAEDAQYEQAIMNYASVKFTYGQIDNAIANGYISQEHYDATIELKLLIEPRPLSLKVEEPTV